MKNAFRLLLMTCFFYACNNYTVPLKNSTPIIPVFDTANTVILPLDSIEHAVFNSHKDAEINNNDLRIIDSLMALVIINQSIGRTSTYTKQAVNQQNVLTRILGYYKRQIACFIDSNGNKTAWVNCFCLEDSQEFTYWKKQRVLVDDGGDCFFNFKVDMTTHKSFDISINGVATAPFPYYLLPPYLCRNGYYLYRQGVIYF